MWLGAGYLNSLSHVPLPSIPELPGKVRCPSSCSSTLVLAFVHHTEPYCSIICLMISDRPQEFSESRVLSSSCPSAQNRIRQGAEGFGWVGKRMEERMEGGRKSREECKLKTPVQLTVIYYNHGLA